MENKIGKKIGKKMEKKIDRKNDNKIDKKIAESIRTGFGRSIGRSSARRQSLPGSYTVEAAGVMSAVLFTILVLLGQAFRLQAETVGEFRVHREVEAERHKTERIDEDEISRAGQGQRWSLSVTAPVFRPEKSLRFWSLGEKDE